jgi:hypothetical protein
MKIKLSALLLSLFIWDVSQAEVDAAKWNHLIELMPQSKHEFSEKWNNWDISFTDFLGAVPKRRLERISRMKTTGSLVIEHNSKDIAEACEVARPFNAALRLTVPSLPENLDSFENAPKVEGPLVRMRSNYDNNTYSYNRDALNILLERKIKYSRDGKINLDLSGQNYQSIACAILSGELDAEIYYKISYEVGTPVMLSDVWVNEYNFKYISDELNKDLEKKPTLKNDQAAKLILTGILLQETDINTDNPKVFEKWNRPLKLLKALSAKSMYVLRDYRIPNEFEVTVDDDVVVSSTNSIDVSIRKIKND